jgi:hypothetical protein
MDTCHVVGMAQLYKYWPLVRFPTSCLAGGGGACGHPGHQNGQESEYFKLKIDFMFSANFKLLRQIKAN